MKTLIITLMLTSMFVVSLIAQSNNVWSAPIKVTQTVSSVKINNVSIATLPTGQIAVTVAWSWLDDSGKIVRTGITRYTQAEIEAKLASKGSSVAQFKALFLAIAQEEAVN